MQSSLRLLTFNDRSPIRRAKPILKLFKRSGGLAPNIKKHENPPRSRRRTLSLTFRFNVHDRAAGAARLTFGISEVRCSYNTYSSAVSVTNREYVRFDCDGFCFGAQRPRSLGL